MRWLRIYRLPFLSALAFNLAFYPWRLEWIIWVAAVPLLVWLTHPDRSIQHITTGLFLIGTVYHLTLLAPFLSIGWWGWGPTTVQGLRDYFSYQRVFMVCLILGVSFWGGLVLAGIGRFLRGRIANPLVAVWLVPSVWVLILEYLGHGSVFGFSWGLIGNRLHGQVLIRQTASLTGVYGLSFLIMMVNATVASWVIELRRRIRSSHHAPRASSPSSGHSALWGATAMTGAILAAAFGYGRARLQQTIVNTPALRVALLQGARADYAFDDFTPAGIDRLYLAMIDTAIRQRAELVLLPETVWLKTLQLDGTIGPWTHEVMSTAEMQRFVATRLHQMPALFICGMDAIREGRTYNTTTFWTAEQLIGVYRKRRLVPFAEYRPTILGPLAPQNRIHGPQFTYTPGQGTQLVRWGAIPIGAFICQEVMFPSLVRRTVRDGAQLLVTTGNDGVFKSPIVAWEQANLAQLRAVESGRYLLRCMKTGVSAIIDPQGRVVASAPLNAQSVLFNDHVRPIAQLTWYAKMGDWMVGFSALVVALAILTDMSRRAHTSKLTPAAGGSAGDQRSR